MRSGNRNGFPSDGTPLKRAKFITHPASGARCGVDPDPKRREKHRYKSASRGSSVVRFYYSSARFSDANQPPLFTLKVVKRFKHADDLSVFHSVGRVFFSAWTTRERERERERERVPAVGARCIYAFCEICLKYSGLVCWRVLPRQKDTQGAGRRCGSPLFVPVAEDGGLELTWDSESAFPLRERARASR